MKLKDIYGNSSRFLREHFPLIRHHYEKPSTKIEGIPSPSLDPLSVGTSAASSSSSSAASTQEEISSNRNHGEMQQPFKRQFLSQKKSFDSQGSRTSFPGKGIKAIEKMPSLRSLVDHSDNENLYDDNSPMSEDIYGGSRRSTIQIQKWDVFREIPIEESNSGNQKCLERMVKILKIFAYVLTFIVVLCTGVVSKGSVLFMASQIGTGRKTPFCRLPPAAPDKRFEAEISAQEQAQWIWALAFTYLFPEIFTFLRSARMCVFKSFRRPHLEDVFMVCLFETLHTVGMALLAFIVLPELDAVKGAMLTNCVCIMPAILALLSRHKTEEKRVAKIVIDILAIVAQSSGLYVWPIVLSDKLTHGTWAIPTSIVLISFGWWENYVDHRSSIGFIRHMAKIKDRLKRSRYFIYTFVSCWKMAVFFAAMVGFVSMTAVNANVDRFGFLKNFFSVEPRSLTVRSVNTTAQFLNLKRTDGVSSLLNLHSTEPELESVSVVPTAALVTLVIQVCCGFVCYVFAKFACRICIQGFSYAFPVNLTIPVTISLLIAACGVKMSDVCFLKDVIPRYLYWVCPNDDFFITFVSTEQGWIWLLWLLSQTWITLHIWIPKCERLASTERLFVTPMYNGILIDQSLGMNRRRDEEDEVKTKDLDIDGNPDDRDAPCYETISEHTESAYAQDGSGAKSIDQITHIFACATMWHETDEEMMEMLKSIVRMDEDQSARRNAQKYLQIVDPDYYEFETHIFFDDAFEMSDENEDENVVNRFVHSLVRVIDEAASKVHQCTIRVKPPTKIPTPYGGRLVWTLPGKTKMVAHLKDKSKIRHRKRWSQVMYMYYLLGHRLMERDLDVNRKEALAENTYILTLDGDIDFQPHAVQLLVDLMKKNRNLGAACGRIHPVGSGLMQWYQKFEYAMGHWLQKATEHMIGCVLCSPGCFSLFRAKALMDDNVMRRYTTRSNEARHYVQYDQGEDRWLCTLLLQRGYRVEYSAASDAYTHCPEGFNEFFNQRRRWVPSTMANILDLLVDSRRTVKVNDNISTLYIIYQGMLMIGTILGPGTIFLMLVGAFVAAFKIDNWSSFYYNIVPILFFMIVCFICKADLQLVFAQILSAGYALVMMAVLVGISLQMREDGVGSPSFIFFIMLSGSFIVSAVLHPQEVGCLVPSLLYYLSIPSMYLLLIIYSLINLNNVSWGTREVLTKKTREVIIAQILTSVYALVMMAVIVGILLQISHDGMSAPSTFFTISVAGSLVAAAVLHPKEFSCVYWGWLYWLSIPSMYLLLMIYSLLNMDNVSWGTREVLTKKSREEVEEERRQAEENKKKQKQNNILGLFGAKNNEELDGGFTVNLANLCSFMLCTHPKPKDEQMQLLKVQDTLDTMMKRLDYIERSVESVNPNLPPRRRSSFARSTGGRSSDRDHLSALAEEGHDEEDNDDFSSSSGSDSSHQLENKRTRDDLLDPYWIDDKLLKRGPIEYLPGQEIQFWKDMLAKYLYPIDANKEELARLSVELKELRNKAVFSFFMFNALFILIVFLLQLNKDNLYVNWPLGVKTNITFDHTAKAIMVTHEYLHLEPIGFVFVIFFALIVAIQFVGMMFHRFGTLSHILASTEISCCNRKVEEMSDDAFIQRNAVEIARAFQRLRGLDGEDEGSEDGSGSDHAVGRRKTIHNLEKSMKRKQRVGTLDVAFRQRFFNLNAEGKIEGTPVLNGMRKLSMRRETMQALAHRRNTMFNADRERMRTLGARNSVQPNRNRHRPTVPHASAVFPQGNGNLMQGISNEAFDHSSEEDRESRSSRLSSRMQVNEEVINQV